MQFDLDTATRRLDKKLSQLRAKSYISEELVNLLDAVSHAQLTARNEAEVELPATSDLALPEAVFQGVPLVGREDFPFDAPQAKRLFNEFMELLQKQGGPMGEGATVIDKAIKDGTLSVDELFEKFLEDDHAFFAPWVERMPDAPKTLSFLVSAALAPSLEAAAALLADLLPEMKVPAVGTCPLCGSLPLISSLEQKKGSATPPAPSVATTTASSASPARSVVKRTRRS